MNEEEMVKSFSIQKSIWMPVKEHTLKQYENKTVFRREKNHC